MKYRLSTLLLLVLCAGLGTALFRAYSLGVDKARLANDWYDKTDGIILLTLDKGGLFSKKEYNRQSGLSYVIYDGTYGLLNDNSFVVTVNSLQHYSWVGQEEWKLDREEVDLDDESYFQFAINGNTLVLIKTGGLMRGPHGGVFTLDGG